MSDLESQLRAARAALPDAPPVSEATREAMRRGLAARGAGRATAGWRRRLPRSRRGRIGGALALAGALTLAGLASAGLPPFGVPAAVERDVDVSAGKVVATIRDGTQEILVAPGQGAHAGEICVTLANAQGPTDVSPVGCAPPSRADDPGFGFSERPPGRAGWGFHVRVPDTGDLASAIASEFVIPANGGTVTFQSGDRQIVITYPDTRALDARADRDARAHHRALLAKARAGIETPEAQRRLPTLPAGQREALELWIIQELPYELAAKRLGVTVPVARARVSRALKALGVDMQGMLP